jgi:N-acetylglutamate synthase-like GNAT family acetyltransferase
MEDVMIYRKAKMADVEAIHGLINKYARLGLMLARSRSSLYECLREYTVVEADGQVIGVGGLHILWADLAEIRSLAIASEYAKMGIGKRLVGFLEEEANELGIPKNICPNLPTRIFLLNAALQRYPIKSCLQRYGKSVSIVQSFQTVMSLQW